MKHICRFTCEGYLGKDLILNNTNSGTPYTSLSIGSSYQAKLQNGQWEKRTRWNYVTAWGQLANYLCQYAGKGTLVRAEGTLETVMIQKQGNQTEFKTNLNARDVAIMHQPTRTQQPQNQTTQNQPSQQKQYFDHSQPHAISQPTDFIEDDIPF